MKWDQKNNRDLYCQALVHDRTLHSLRDLTADHLPMLENLLDKGRAAVAKHYDYNVSYSAIFMSMLLHANTTLILVHMVGVFNP